MSSNVGNEKLLVYLNEKAGMGGVDKKKIQQIVMESTEGSTFHEEVKRKAALQDQKISLQKERLVKLSRQELELLKSKAMACQARVCSERCLNRIWVVCDMDMFFAAVEMRDNPALRDIPFAVGGMSMISTSNYLARAFGVRAAMPGFVGKKLCPQLVLVDGHMDKYAAVAEEIRAIFSKYDPSFQAGSLDEGYLDITDYCQQIAQDENGWGVLCDHSGPSGARILDEAGCKVCEACPRCCSGFSGCIPQRVVQEMRAEIFRVTQLTCSAGIAVNPMLAKIASDCNKPNGQFLVPPCEAAIVSWVGSLPVRKIPGVGPATQRSLDAVFGVEKCSQVLEITPTLFAVYTERAAEWLIRVCLGIGSVERPQDDDAIGRKSLSCERTFRDESRPEKLLEVLQKCSAKVSKELLEERIEGKTVTVKMKFTSFRVKQKAMTLPTAVNSQEKIFAAAKTLFKSELPLTLPLRLLGVRLSSLKPAKADKSVQPSLLELDELQRARQACATCTYENPRSAKECTMCGANLRKRKLEEEEEKRIVCPICGENLPQAQEELVRTHVTLCCARQDAVAAEKKPAKKKKKKKRRGNLDCLLRP